MKSGGGGGAGEEGEVREGVAGVEGEDGEGEGEEEVRNPSSVVREDHEELGARGHGLSPDQHTS